MTKGSITAALASLARHFKFMSTAESGRATATMSAVQGQLFEALFPGQQYSVDRAGELAARLRSMADELQPSAAQQQAQEEDGAVGGPRKKRKKDKDSKGGKDLDFSSYHSRYVALELLYLGGAYQGFAAQADSEETIEGHLFRAMRKTRLIRPDASWQDIKYSRGGRTDKGVSALGQVVAVTVRSTGRADQPLPGPELEMDYPSVLNRALPEDIRVTGWAPVPDDFSARFSARYREYKYFVVQRGEALDVGRMQEAAQHFLGEHDFRNFCKVDAEHVSNFRRTILDFRIEQVEGCGWGADRQLYELYIRGTAFLWHQVRCMAAVLFLVGRGEEEPGVVSSLLDVEAHPAKPQYCLASEAPLLLYSCTYEGLEYRRGASSHSSVVGALGEMLDRQLVAAGMLTTILQRLEGNQTQPDAAGAKKKERGPRYVKLLKRATEPSLEARLAKYNKQLGGVGAAEGGGPGGAPAQQQAVQEAMGE